MANDYGAQRIGGVRTAGAQDPDAFYQQLQRLISDPHALARLGSPTLSAGPEVYDQAGVSQPTPPSTDESGSPSGPPQIPVYAKAEPDLQTMQDTMRRANAVGLVGSAAGRVIPNGWGFRHGIMPFDVNPGMTQAAQKMAMQPAVDEQLRAGQQNDARDLLNRVGTERLQAATADRQTIAGIAGSAARFQAERELLGQKQGGELAKTGLENQGKANVANISAHAKMAAAQLQAGIGIPVDPAIVDMESDRYLDTGDIHTPKGLTRGQGSAFVRAVQAAAASKRNESGDQTPLAATAADYGANRKALDRVQATATQMHAFEGTARANLQTFLDAAKAIRETGSPWLNKPFRQWDQKALGSTEMSAFNAARQIVTPEIARVLQTATGTGVLSNDSRHEVDTILDPNATLDQQITAAKVIMTDFDNRSASWAAEQKGLVDRLGKHRPHAKAGPSGAPVKTFRRNAAGQLEEVTQ